MQFKSLIGAKFSWGPSTCMLSVADALGHFVTVVTIEFNKTCRESKGMYFTETKIQTFISCQRGRFRDACKM